MQVNAGKSKQLMKQKKFDKNVEQNQLHRQNKTKAWTKQNKEQQRKYTKLNHE